MSEREFRKLVKENIKRDSFTIQKLALEKGQVVSIALVERVRKCLR